MSGGRRRVAALLAAALAVAAAAALLHPGGRPPGAAVAAGAPGPPGAGRRWSLALELAIHPEGRAPGRTLRLTGEWSAVVSAVRADGYDLAHGLRQVRVEGAGAAPDAEAALARRLERTFWVSYRADGAALRAAFPRDLAPEDRNLLQGLATALQRVRPPVPAAAWPALERDGGGLYQAVYEQAAPGLVVKRKLRYLAPDGQAGPAGAALALEVANSRLRFALDGAGALAGLEGEETLRVAAPGPGGALLLETRLRLEEARDGADPSAAGSLARAAAAVEGVPIRTHAPDPAAEAERRDQALLAGWPAAALLSGEGPPDPQRGARLAALVRAAPGGAAAVAGAARARPGDPAPVEALGAAGTPAAAEALAALAADPRLPRAARVHALTALARARRPTAAALEGAAALLGAAEPEVRHAAQLACGALARSARATAPAPAAALEAALVARAGAAGDPRERERLLDALGNAGGAAVLPALRAALADGAPAVRAAAARALRGVEGEEAERLLRATLAADADPRVRAAAVFAASFRPPGPLEAALETAGREDPSPAVRAAAQALLRAGQRPGAAARPGQR